MNLHEEFMIRTDIADEKEEFFKGKDGEILNYEAVFYRNEDTSVREYNDEDY